MHQRQGGKRRVLESLQHLLDTNEAPHQIAVAQGRDRREAAE